MSALLVIDAGTTAFKAVIFDRQMQIVGLASREFEIIHPASNRSELDAQAYWLSCVSAVQEAVNQGAVNPGDIAAVAVTSHTDTLFALNESGQPVADAIFWTDPRAREQADYIQQQISLERLFRTTGQTGAASIHFASRLAWFIENNAELCSNVQHFLQTQDYLIYRLSGQAVLDQSIACSSLLGYLERMEYWPEMLDLVGVNVEKLSRIISPGQIAGTLTDAAAQSLGLCSGIPVVAASMDQTATAIAMGNVKPGLVAEATGAALVIATTCDSPKFDERIQVPCFAHAVPEKYMLMPWCETAGAALKWYRDQFFGPQADTVQARGDRNLYDLITAEAAEAPPGSDGVIVLPHFAGSGAPEFNPSAKAVVYGLTIAHQRKHISRAFLESVAFMLKQNLDALERMGIEMDRIVSSGGGSRSPLWCQIKADVTGLPVVVADIPEATSRGAAMLAAKALRWPSENFGSPAEKCKGRAIFKPQSAAHSVYRNAFDRFIELNQLLQPMFVDPGPEVT